MTLSRVLNSEVFCPLKQDVTVASDTPAIEAVKIMHDAGSSYVLVVEQQRLVGIVTRHDIVTAIATGVALDRVAIAAIMTAPVITLTTSEAQQASKVHQQLRQHHIRHLPLVDSQQQVVGMVTPAALENSAEALQQKLDETLAKLGHEVAQTQQLKQSLAASEVDCRDAAQLNCIFHSTPVSIVRFRAFRDRTWHYEYWSAGCETIFGYTAQELITTPNLWRSRVLPEDLESVIVPCLEEIFTECRTTLEYRFYHKDGSLHWAAGVLTSQYHPSSDSWIVTAVDRDVTDQKQTEQALEESKAYYQSLVDVLPQCVYRKDREGRMTFGNQAFLATLGKPLAACLGLTVYDLYPKELADQYHQNDLHVMQTGEAIDRIEQHQSLTSSEIRYVQAVKAPVRDATGEIIGTQGIFWDITERSRAEEAVRQSEARFQRLAANVPGVIFRYLWQADGSDAFTYVSPGSYELCELTPQMIEQDAKRLWALIHPEDAQSLQQSIADSIATLQPWHWEGRLLTPSGHLKWIQGAARLDPQADGNTFWDGLIIDISDRKRIEAEHKQLYQTVQQLNATLETQVQERTVQLQTLLNFEALLKRITEKVRESLDERHIFDAAVQELSEQLQVEFCNVILYERDEQGQELYPVLSERNCASPELTHLVLPASEFQAMQAQIEQGQPCHFCAAIDGWNSGWATALVCPMIDDNGALLGDVLLLRDREQVFSELEIRLVQQVATQCAIAIRQSRLYKAAQQQVVALERLNQLKDDFLSTISHELRTPISTLQLTTEMLELSLKKQGILTEAEAIADLDPTASPAHLTAPNSIPYYFKILREECWREISLINDLLDLSRLDAETEPLFLTTMSLQFWLPHVAEPFVERMRKQHQTLEFDLPTTLSPLKTDFAYLERILTELLHNACKYTPEAGTIRVSAQVVGEADAPLLPMAPRKQMHQIRVANSGIEIPAVEHTRIFEKFYRIPDSDPWKQGGTGLGLALVKKRVEQIKGAIAVSVEPGWTIFTVQLPSESLDTFSV